MTDTRLTLSARSDVLPGTEQTARLLVGSPDSFTAAGGRACGAAKLPVTRDSGARSISVPSGLAFPRVSDSNPGASAAMIHIVLFQPEIPQNTGNVGRMCALTRSRLHLIHPLGYVINDRNLRRAGMDYWRSLDVHEHADWPAFRRSDKAPRRLWLFTTKAAKSFWDVTYSDEDGLVFGNEGSGAPDWLHAELGEESRVTIPHANPMLRSLNLSTAAGIACYEALRQTALLPGVRR